MEDMQQLPQEDHGKRFFSWTFPEFEEHDRGMWWYIISGIAVLGLLLYAIYTANYLFAVIIALIAFISIVRLQRKPALVTFTITEDGLEVHESFYQWKDIKNFWVIYDPPETKRVYFEFKSGLRPMLTVPLESQNPVVIRDTLLQYIDEDLEKEEELLSDALQRKLKF